MAESSSSFGNNNSTFSEKNSKRKTRNESEKRRRDTFNQLISELTLLVAKDDRKMDKSSVLKCAINFLKQQHFQAESTSGEASNVALDSKLRITTGCNLPEIVQLYMDALAAGTFCIHCSGHIEHASTSFAALFDDTIYDLQGKNFFDLLDDASAESFSGAISTELLHSVPASTAMHSTTTLQERVTTKKLRRQLLEPNESLRFVGVIVPLSNPPESEVTLETISSWERRNANFTVLYNTEFVCVDAEGCQLLGYSRLDLLGTSGYDYIHMDDLLQVAESHTQLIKLGTYQIRPHRLQTKSHQWIWVNCMAIIFEGEASIKKVRCNYRVVSMENVKKFKETITFMKSKSTEILLPLSIAVSSGSNSQNPPCTTSAISTVVCPLSITSALSAVGNNLASFCATDDSSSEQPNDSVSVIASEKHTNSSCTAKIVIGPLPPKRMRKGGSNVLPGSYRYLCSDNIPSTSFGCTSSRCQRLSTALSSLSSEPLSSKRRSQIPLAFIEHYPLPDSKLADNNESRKNTLNLTLSSTSTVGLFHTLDGNFYKVTPAALSISPMYQQVWEELQHRSEILRQQVFQKEMELRELHLKRFLASLNGDKY
ncbi:unnamed protein product [Acanthocheilonema viteae]|uniref:BHLH domain-containing protein n=1 Tax=Acanthocheilonema viteae TaxID=6277 RepID=A0A498S665_ACAVI|nr:unnamed protein product [Acanthocheilonema viteae]